MTEQSPAEALFFAALAKPSADRAAFLDANCPDPALRARVDKLLAAQPKVGDFLEADATTAAHDEPPTAAPGLPATEAHSSGDVGQLVADRYKLLERIGEGGMGTVWMAEQRTPVKRLVAVKLVKPGLETRAVLARFEAERQALAVMDHPSIARVLDAGATADGRPFFVMELVKGVPITRYCDDARLTPRQRLELFVPVCQAIQHAHTKGVIHRDIKPGNVLVALYDGRPVPKVIDFGIAKAAGQPLTDKTLHTGFGAVVGTPEYMSPEQASFNQLDVDTRSDVYSLGVLLYELLTGGPPFSSKELQHAGLLEMLRVVREVEPPRPSVRLFTATGLASLAATRGTEPARLAGLVRGEVDWIVMKALAKDRGRRYETATGLAADVSRHLAGEPVQAVPPSAGYRVRTFVRRHRARVAVAATVLLALVAGLAGTGWQAVRATYAERVAREAEVEAVKKRNEAEVFREFADYNGQLNADTSKEVIKSLVKLDAKTRELQIDMDLVEVQIDSRVGVLKLSKSISAFPKVGLYTFNLPDASERQETGMALAKQIHEITGKPVSIYTGGMSHATAGGDKGIRAIHEFAIIALLAHGQEYAPLLPPMNRGGGASKEKHLSHNGRSLLILREGGTTQLLDIRTASVLATLREGTEQVVRCGFSPDGHTAFTSDLEGVTRFWNLAGGLRSKTRYRQSRNATTAIATHGNETRINNSRGVAVVSDKSAVIYAYDLTEAIDHGSTWTSRNRGPVELYDTATGHLLARLDRPGHELTGLQYVSNERWISAIEDRTQAVLYSAADGREIVRLLCPQGQLRSVSASPDGSMVITDSGVPGQDRTAGSIRLWDTRTWQHLPSPNLDGLPSYFVPDFMTNSILGQYSTDGLTLFSLVHPGGLVYSQNVAQVPDGGWLQSGDSHPPRLLDGKTLKRLMPPPGRPYHPAYARVAADGRFLLARGYHLDTATEKGYAADWDFAGGQPLYIPGFGHIAIKGEETRLLPAPDRLDYPPKLLELWAQVAVRGELGPDGAFVPWDHDTWQRKWQQLAAAPPPYPDFPFPGHLARDPLHWLRKEFEAAADAARLPLARELLRRAEAAGDAAEAARWRREVRTRVPEVAPAPRPVVN